MEVSKELFDEFIQWLKLDGLKPKKSERLWKKTIFAHLLHDDKKTLDNWEDFMLENIVKQSEKPIKFDFDEYCLQGIGVSVSGVHKTILQVVKGETMSRVFFEDGADVDVENIVLMRILDAHRKDQHADDH